MTDEWIMMWCIYMYIYTQIKLNNIKLQERINHKIHCKLHGTGEYYVNRSKPENKDIGWSHLSVVI